MKKQRNLIKAAGFITILFSVFHLFFYWMFNWQTSLQCLDLNDWAIFHTFNLIIDLMFILFSVLSIFYSTSLITESTGKIWLLFMASVYIVRIMCEFVLWGFNWAQSPVVILLCLVPAVFYLIPIFNKKS